MAEQSYFMGQDGFIWFVGVVEDRNDPELLGRVRVRCLGFHTEDLNSLPTVDLPWAHVMHPVTDPSMHGMGNTPSFLVEGSWVIGFFRDAQEKQQPVIIGSLPGVPSAAADYTKGFNDPRHPEVSKDSKQVEYKGSPTYGPYPGSTSSGHSFSETDTNRLAQGPTSETHNSLINRRLNRLRGDPTKIDDTVGIDDSGIDFIGLVKGTGIPTATQPYLSLVQDGAKAETRGFWNEPHPKSITKNAKVYRSGQYPYNHVHESESGHIREIDDSPGAERLFTQHKSGTFEEIHPTGTKVVKIVGDNYEIVAGSSNIYIGSNENGTSDVLNLTINGNVRELIKGDYHLEVEGNYTQKIHKNHRVKIGAGEGGGNREEEIKGNHAYQIGTGLAVDEDGVEIPPPDDGHVKARITGNIDTVIDKSEVRIINDSSSLSVKNAIKIAAIGPVYPDTLLTSGDITIAAFNNLSTTTISGITTFKSGDKLNIKSATAMDIKTEDDGLTIYSEGLVTETFKASHTSVVTGTLDLDVSVEVDVDSALINLN
jgi:hypothetical protein